MPLQHRLEFVGVHAGGEGAANQAAHAGAGGHVDRNAVLLEPADDADVGDAARAAAAEGDADDRTAARGGIGNGMLRLQSGGSRRGRNLLLDRRGAGHLHDDRRHAERGVRRNATASRGSRLAPRCQSATT